MATPSPQLSPGRELDALVASRVLGWTNVGFVAGRGDHYGTPARRSGAPFLPPGRAYKEPVPRCSTDIAAAWSVVERLTDPEGPFGENKVGVRIDHSGYAMQFPWFADFSYRARANAQTEWDIAGASKGAGSAPAAVCLAALAVVEALEKAKDGEESSLAQSGEETS